MLSLILILCATAAQSTSDQPQPDRWRGLILNETTPDQAIAILGKPKSDKPDRLFIHEIDKWFEPGLNKKNLRKQSFRDVAGFDRVDLYYRDDKLVVMQLDPEKNPIKPTALQNIYGIEFRPFVGGFRESHNSWDFERHAGQVYPKTFPESYTLVGVSPGSIVAAAISNTSVGSILRQLNHVRDTAGGGFPGKVHHIQLISRKLENRAGADLLK